MNAKWLGVALLAAAAAACGEGRVIFDVDVYSFLTGTGQDTVRYLVLPCATPPCATIDAGSVPQKINLPGAGSSIVDSVRFFGTGNLMNQSGSGTISIQLFLAPDSAGTYSAANRAITVPPKSVSGTSVTPDTIQADLTTAFNDLFTRSELWMRAVAGASNSGATILQGKAVLTSLRARVVIREKVF